MAQRKKPQTKKTQRKQVRVGGRRGLSGLRVWQKLLLLVLFAGVVSLVSITMYSQYHQRDLTAKAASYTKVDIRSNPKSSAQVAFHACKTVSGDRITATILATKPKSVMNAKAVATVYQKKRATQSAGRTTTNTQWWGGEVTAMQLVLSQSGGDELVFSAQSRSGQSKPQYSVQPVRKTFKTDAAYQAALKEFQAATINPSSFIDCNKAASSRTAENSICLNRKGSRKVLSDLQKREYRDYSIAKNTVYDARRAYWDGTTSTGVPVSWAIGVDGAGPACWYGGKYTGAWNDRSPDVTWSKDYHHAGAMTIRMSDFLVEGYRAHNQGDGIRMESRAANFHIKDVYMSDIHDDCVENDFLHNGITEDSLFEGCFAGFSAATYDGINPNGQNNTWTIRNNLMSMKPYYTMFKPEKYGNYGFAMLFKGWYAKDKGPKLVIENNVFMADRKSSIGNLSIPANAEVKSCKNNTFVWLGEGEFPYTLPSCFKITKDKAVWTNAVAKWKADRPTIR